MGGSSVPDPTLREAELSEQLARATAQLIEVQCENRLLREKIDALIKRLFGAQSEKIDPGQLLLMLQGLDAPGKAPEPVEARPPSILPFPFRLLGGGATALDGPIASA